MSNNVVRLKTTATRRKAKAKMTNSDNVVELPLLNMNITPQELLAMLSRRPDIVSVVVIFPTDIDGGAQESTNIVSSQMTNAELNFYGDKLKFKALGIEV
jgi:hypothetical protein